MKIFPKISTTQIGSEEFIEEIRKSDGIEIQFFNEPDKILQDINFEEAIIRYKNQFPNLIEFTIHPPLQKYNIEYVLMKNKDIIPNFLERCKKLSSELEVRINLLFHTYWTVDVWSETGIADEVKGFADLLNNTNVYLYIENLYMMLDEKEECSALQIVKHLNHKHVRVCLDTTHLHCKANMFKQNFEDTLMMNLNKEDAEEYVEQVHFGACLNGDGYIDKKNHGRMHETIEDVKYELEWLERYGMSEKKLVTEIGEEDYLTRDDQLREIRMIKEVKKDSL